MTVLFVILPKQLAVQNKPQETPAEEKASPWGKQTSAEVAVTWRSFSWEQHGSSDSLSVRTAAR